MKTLALVFTFFTCISAAVGQTVKGQIGGETTTLKPVAAATPTQNEQERYRIGFQDIIEIQVFHHPDLNQKVAVGSSGSISLFRLERPVKAVCKTERELATDITNAYKEKYLKDPQINVMVVEQKSQSFAVIGAVEKPGNYYISRKLHLLELLAYAGGPSKEAGTRILVARAGSKSSCKENTTLTENDPISIMDFKLRDVQEGKQTLWMQAGDVVSILDADIVYMYGNLMKPGPLKIREPITLRQAIASAEGLKRAAATDKIRVLRRVQGKAEPEELVFNLEMIDKGKLKDPILEPNDIVAVSQDTSKAIMIGIGNTIKAAVPSAIYAIP